MKDCEYRALRDAIKAKEGGFDGVGGKGPRRKVCERLAGMGLLRYVGHGTLEEGTDREFPIYEATDLGVAVFTGAST